MNSGTYESTGMQRLPKGVTPSHTCRSGDPGSGQGPEGLRNLPEISGIMIPGISIRCRSADPSMTDRSCFASFRADLPPPSENFWKLEILVRKVCVSAFSHLRRLGPVSTASCTTSPIGLYLVIALAASGESIQTFVELSDEQEVNHGGVEGAAREGLLELLSLGHVRLQYVGAIPVQTEAQGRELFEQWERDDQRDLDDLHHL